MKAASVKTDLKMLLPSQLRVSKCKSCYILVFNEDTDEYNKIPNNNGKYHIYTASYSIDEHNLEIDDFSYDFKK